MSASTNGQKGALSQIRDDVRESSNPQDEEAAAEESTPLLSLNHDLASPTGSDSSEGLKQLLEEAHQPWPATYDRSIALLASPIISPKQVELFTHSPKPGASHATLAQLRKQMNESPLPQGRLLPPAKQFKQGVERVQSMDFVKKNAVAPTTQKKMEALTLATLDDEKRKAAEAKAYRQKLLQQQQQQHQEGEAHKAKAKANGKTTFAQCVFNMANILMGVGLLGLPFVFKSAGWYGGIFATILFAFITWKTSILIGRELNGDPRPAHELEELAMTTPKTRMRRPIRSFPDIARESFGEVGCLALCLVLYFELFSCLCIFLVSLGDHLHSIFPSVSVTHHMIIAAVVSTIPTVVLHTPRLLSYLSMVGTFATISVVVAVVLSAVLEGDLTEKAAKARGMDDSGEPQHIFWRTAGLPIAFGMIAYSFSGHAIVPSIYTSMERPQDFDRVINTSFLIVFVCCLAVAISGYYMFGFAVQDQVTLSLAESSSAVKAMKCLIWLMILTAFSKLSLTVFPLALGMEEIVATYLSTDEGMVLVSSIIKLVLTFLALLIAIFVPSFSLLCSLVGLICTLAVSVIFPAAAHLKLFGPKLSVAEKCLDWFFVAFGLTVAIIGTIATVR